MLQQQRYYKTTFPSTWIISSYPGTPVSEYRDPQQLDKPVTRTIGPLDSTHDHQSQNNSRSSHSLDRAPSPQRSRSSVRQTSIRSSKTSLHDDKSIPVPATPPQVSKTHRAPEFMRNPPTTDSQASKKSSKRRKLLGLFVRSSGIIPASPNQPKAPTTARFPSAFYRGWTSPRTKTKFENKDVAQVRGDSTAGRIPFTQTSQLSESLPSPPPQAKLSVLRKNEAPATVVPTASRVTLDSPYSAMTASTYDRGDAPARPPYVGSLYSPNTPLILDSTA